MSRPSWRHYRKRYGTDAPNVVRNLFLYGILAAPVGFAPCMGGDSFDFFRGRSLFFEAAELKLRFTEIREDLFRALPEDLALQPGELFFEVDDFAALLGILGAQIGIFGSQLYVLVLQLIHLENLRCRHGENDSKNRREK